MVSILEDEIKKEDLKIPIFICRNMTQNTKKVLQAY